MIHVDCSNCGNPLQLSPGADSRRCSICQAITNKADSGVLPSSNSQIYPLAPHQPPLSPPHLSAHSPKKAVLCGVSYRNLGRELKGCINDVKCMRYLLINRFNFPESSIRILTEEETDPSRLPTKENIKNALSWLVQGCQPGDSLVFHYSGHGFQQKNINGDELDGFDEMLCPMDFKTEGTILDDELNAMIVNPLPHGVKLHAIIDACHSGTVLDLPFLCRMDRNGQYIWEDHRPKSGTWKGTSGGEVISFTGCDDDQTSEDTPALSKVAPTGAMTYCFIKALEDGQDSTYGSILNSMRKDIRNARIPNEAASRSVTTLMSMLLKGGSLYTRLTQEPQLSTNEQFDVYKKQFFL